MSLLDEISHYKETMEEIDRLNASLNDSRKAIIRKAQKIVNAVNKKCAFYSDKYVHYFRNSERQIPLYTYDREMFKILKIEVPEEFQEAIFNKFLIEKIEKIRKDTIEFHAWKSWDNEGTVSIPLEYFEQDINIASLIKEKSNEAKIKALKHNIKFYKKELTLDPYMVDEEQIKILEEELKKLLKK